MAWRQTPDRPLGPGPSLNCTLMTPKKADGKRTKSMISEDARRRTKIKAALELRRTRRRTPVHHTETTPHRNRRVGSAFSVGRRNTYKAYQRLPPVGVHTLDKLCFHAHLGSIFKNLPTFSSSITVGQDIGTQVPQPV